ncbi:MAG: hypothetical protein JSR73_03470, partial [Proteobacteria bacterium]|nr:hypothetical protein [Pseudomonadota bacterium]
LSGTATPHQEISLHVFSDSPEAVTLRLLEDHIQYRVAEHRVRMNAERVLQVPALQFSVYDYPVDATVFPRDGIRQSPLSPSDGRPMRRAALAEVRALVEDVATEREP